MPEQPHYMQRDALAPSVPPLPPRSHPKHRAHPQPGKSILSPTYHSFMQATTPASKLPSSTTSDSSELPPPLSLPASMISPTSLPAPLSFSRASTAPSTSPNSSSSPYRYPYPHAADAKREYSHSSAASLPYPHDADVDYADHSALPSSVDAPFPTALPATRSPVAVRPSPAKAASPFSLPSLTRLCSTEPIALSDIPYWTDGQVALHAEIAALHAFGSRGEDEDDGEAAVKVSNAALQRLVNAAHGSGNVRRLLLVHCYHLRHLIEQQRKHEARHQYRQRQTLKRHHQQRAAISALGLAAPLPDALPPPSPAKTLSATDTTSQPQSTAPTFPGEGHWLLCLTSNIRLLVQTLLERLPCHHRELFFQHLRRRRDLSSSPPAQSPRQSDYDALRSPLPDDAPLLSRSRSCNDAVSPSASASSPEHFISIPLPASAMPHPTEDRGEDVLRMLLSTLMQAVVHLPVERSTEALHREVLALMFALLEAHDVDECDVHSAEDADDDGLSHRTFLEPLVLICEASDHTAHSREPVPSKLAFRLMHTLLMHYCLRAQRDERDAARKPSAVQSVEQPLNGTADDEGKASAFARLFGKGLPSLTSLSSLVSAGISRSVRFFFPPSTEFLFADQSALLCLWLSYQFGSSASLSSNPLRRVLAQLKDGMDRKSRVGPSADADGALSFEALYRSIALTSGAEWTCVFLFHLLNVNLAFRSFVILHGSLEDLLLPLLHVLYARVELGCNWVYMIINCFLVLSQEPAFNAAMHERRVDERVPWFAEHPLKGLSMHDLVLIVLLRLLQLNMQSDHSTAAYNNALAALANMAAAPVPKGQATAGGSLLSSSPVASSLSSSSAVLHPYAGYLLVSLFCSACQRMTALLHAAVQSSPTRSITSIDDIPAAFNAFEAIGALCLDLLVHMLLPHNVLGHAAALYFLSTDDARTHPLRLQRVLEATRVRVFQHLTEADNADADAPTTELGDFDLLSNLIDFLSAFPSTAPTLTPTLPPAALPVLAGHISRHLRLLPAAALSGGCTQPFPFDPLVFRGHYVYEERDNSCAYFWPHFRAFARRVGMGRGVGGGGAGEGEKGEEGKGEAGPSEEEIRRILESFEGSDYSEVGWDDGR